MSGTSSDALTVKHCVPCEGGVPRLSAPEVERFLREVDPGWEVTADQLRIRRRWKARNFTSAIVFFNQVTELAESEGHHPDLHLTSYREVEIEIWTHAIGGLSENDFILAAKIDTLPFPGAKQTAAPADPDSP